MKRLFTSLSIASLFALGCSAPTAPFTVSRIDPTAQLDCGSNTNNSNNPPATSASCGGNTNNNNNNNNNPPVTAKQP